MNGKVLSIQSHVVHGYVGNTAAAFPLQLLGYEVDALNTVQFSNHTQYPIHTGLAFDELHIQDIFKGLIANNFISGYTHILTGYVGKAKALGAIADNIVKFKLLNPDLVIVVDPVMGDNDHLYVSSELIPIYRDRLCALADVITPNGFEAEYFYLTRLLSGLKPDTDNISVVLDKLHALGPPIVIITSIMADGVCYLYGSKINEAKFKIEIPLKDQNFTGTGDVFSALLLAHLFIDLTIACEKSIDIMQAILTKTMEVRDGRFELALVHSAALILDSPQLHKATSL